MFTHARSLFLILLCVAVPVFGARAAESVEARAMRTLQANCVSCHNSEKHKAGLQLTSRELLLKGGSDGAVVTLENPGESLLIKALAPDADPHMPPKKQLSPAQIETLKQWITEGAKYDEAALAMAAEKRNPVLRELPSGYQPAMALAISPDGKKLAIGRGAKLLIYDAAATNFILLASTNAHKDAVRALAWSPDGKLLASGAFREIRVWDSETLSEKWAVRTNLQDRVSALQFSSHGGALVAGEGQTSESGWVRVYDTANGEIISEWQAHNDAITALAISPDGGMVATSSGDKLVKIWEVLSKHEIGRLEGHMGAVLGTSFNSNATEIISVSLDKQVRVWDVNTKESVVTITGKKHGFTSVAWEGATAVAVDDDGQVTRFRNFKRHNGEQSSSTADEHRMGNFGGPLNAVALSRDATRVAVAGEDGVVRLMDGEGKLLKSFEPESAPMASATAPSFVRDVLPMMAKAGCMAGSCHAKAEGQNGFKLSVFSYDPKSDFDEIVHEARGRRIFPAAPGESLILLKPTMALEHGGGQRFDKDSETYKAIVRWIEEGMVYQHKDEPQLAGISVSPSGGSYKKGESFNLKLEATYTDGSKRDVTHLADFLSNEKELAKVDESGKVQVGGIDGECVIVARYMGLVDTATITIPSEKTIPSEAYAKLPANNFIDRLAYAQFRKLGLLPSEISTDSEFLRRSTLDTIGRLPTAEEAREFLLDSDAGKRKRWVEKLLESLAYGDYWANKWADLLRPNPDRVGVKSVFVLDQWLRESFRANKPYDQFVREILTAEGTNHREGPVVIYRDRREPAELTTIFSQLFLGVRMECAKCHHHPNEKWSQDDFYHLAAFFGPLKQKGAALSPPISAGTETFYFASGGTLKHPVTEAVMKPQPLDAPNFQFAEKEDPRIALANWVTDPRNPFFAKAAVNRVWANFFGRGFVDPVDDFRISNPASNEPLLDALAGDFADHGYDLKHLMRTILNSRLYQLSSTPNETNLRDTRNFSRSYRRRLPAEVLLDGIDQALGVETEFNGCPPGSKAIQAWSYKVRSHFMDAFGRPNPSTDCPCERDVKTSVVQSLHMMNSRELQKKLSSSSGVVKKLADSEKTPEEIVSELYLSLFSRKPGPEETSVAAAAYSAPNATRQSATEDVLWALLNSAEFVFNH